MDVTDGDGEWIVEPGLAETQASAVLAVQARMEEVIDSGVDISVAPLKLAMLGKLVKRSGILMQDAQGRRIPESESRVLEIEVETLGGHPPSCCGRCCIAPVSSIIISMGRVLRWGWSFGTCSGGDGHQAQKYFDGSGNCFLHSRRHRVR